MTIQMPYLLFLGDLQDQLSAKVASGIAYWRPENCIGQFRMEGCQADCNLPDLSLEKALEAGAKTLVVGVANRGGVISEKWVSVFQDALELGFDIASGLHNKVIDIPVLRETATKLGRNIFDVRHPTESLEVGTGKKRSGKRLLPVGTDCSCGKMYTALAIEKEMRSRDIDADFRATGQTGILITGAGLSIDAVVSDFISGAVEHLSPNNAESHWDIIEGQGSLFHPSFAGVSLGLLHGAQPDALVLCHEPSRLHMRGLSHQPLPSLEDCIETNLKAAQLTNPNAKFVGISVNTGQLSETEAAKYLQMIEEKHNLPATDPVRLGVANIIDEAMKI